MYKYVLCLLLLLKISNKTHFDQTGKIADGVVIGSAIIKAISPSSDSTLPPSEKARAFAQSITAGR